MRKTIRRYRYRPYKLRKLRLIRKGLGVFAAAMLLLAGSTIVRSIQTARLNTDLAAIHVQEAGTTETFATAPPSSSKTESPAKPVRMTMPDGSPITREYKQEKGLQVTDAVTSTTFHTAGGNLLPEMEALRKRNRDLAAWLTIDNILDLPVVYRDNSWYLNHDFDGNRNASGTLFLDQGSPVDSRTQNLLIHGHNMKDGSMFAQLTHYQRQDFWRKHPFVGLSTLWEKENYVIFAVMDVPDQPSDPAYVNYFSHPSFPSDEIFSDYMNQVRERSLYPCSLTVKPEDALLTLSTCIGDHHLVILARRLRNNESQSHLKRIL